ncbi:MAG: hypothetical protein AMXMBFR84_06540 [Candidatus Hydrogenedentota bacterium]
MSDPIPSVAAILMAEGDPDRILLVRRNLVLRFMGGFHVFPGGRIEAQESTLNVDAADHAGHAAAIHAVAREVFEETGILCTRGPRPPAEELHDMRVKLLAEAITFDDVLLRSSLRIHAADFRPAGRWVTPPFMPIRFDTQYFLYSCETPADVQIIEGEIIDFGWYSPEEARTLWQKGSIKLPHPVAFALRQLSLRDRPDLLDRLCETSVSKDSSIGRIETRRGIHVLPLETSGLPPATHTNCVLVGEDDLFVIDPGPGPGSGRIGLLDQLDQLCRNGARIHAVLLTHGHPDHVGSAEWVKAHCGAPIWAHRNTRLSFAPDRYLEDGDVIPLAGDPGWRLRCLHTPGHDPGHLCFFEESTRTVIAGDLVSGHGSVVIAPDNGGEMTAYLASLRRVQAIAAKLIIPAHGFPIGKPDEFILNTLDHRLTREARIKAALDGGLETEEALLAEAYKDVHESLWPLARQSLRAHLARLRANTVEQKSPD